MQKIVVNRITLSINVTEHYFHLSFELPYDQANVKVGKGGFNLVLDAAYEFYIFAEDFYCERIEKETDKTIVSGRIEGNFGKYSSMDDLVREAL